ncbi:MAG: CoxG family protein [Hyphomicrobiaceae bacterium]
MHDQQHEKRTAHMEMSGQQKIAASRKVVWAALNDVNVLKQCVPGCESIEKQSDTDMTAKVVLKLGPIKASFNSKLTLADLDPPNGYTIIGEGKGGPAGFAKGTARVRLADDGPNATILNYHTKVDVGGKVAQLGSRLLDSTANRLSAEFFEKFGSVVAPAGATPVQKKRQGFFAWLLGLFGWRKQQAKPACCESRNSA